MSVHQKSIFAQIARERERQDAKFGRQRHDMPAWNLILGEERGEVERAILENDWLELRTELIQVAAVAVAMIEQIDETPLDKLRRLWTPNLLAVG